MWFRFFVLKLGAISVIILWSYVTSATVPLSDTFGKADVPDNGWSYKTWSVRLVIVQKALCKHQTAQRLKINVWKGEAI
jgi:hypothetical protein